MTIGASNVFGFIGWDGPYFLDGNGNQQIDTDPSGVPLAGEVSTSAIGIALNDLNVGAFLGLSTSLTNPGAYFAMNFSVDSLSFVGLDFLTATATLGARINVGAGLSPGAVIDFKASFLDDSSTCVRGPPDVDCNDGFLVNTGDPANPVLVDFDGFLINVEMAGELTVRPDGNPSSDPIVSMLGTFFLEIDGSSFKIFTTAALRVGPDIGIDEAGNPLLDISALGVVIVNSDGFAADLDVDLDIGLPGLDLTVSARVIINTTGDVQSVEIPTRIVDFLNESSSPLASDVLDRLEDCDGIGPGTALCYTISKFAPDILDAATVSNLLGGSGPIVYTSSTGYVVALISGSFDFVGFATGTGVAGVSISPTLFQLHADLQFNIGVSGIDLDFAVNGDLEISSAGLLLDVTVALDVNLTSLFELDVDGSLLIDTRGSTPIFQLALSGDLTIARVLTVNGGFSIDVGAGGANTWRLAMNLSGDLGPIDISADGWIQSDGQFSLSVGGGLKFGISGFSIEGRVDGTVSLIKSGTNYVYSPSDVYTLTVEVSGSVTLTIAGIDIGASVTLGGSAAFSSSGAVLELYAEGCVDLWIDEVCAGGTVASIAIPATIFPEPPPDLATPRGATGILDLNVGARVTERNVAKTTTAESYQLTDLGGGSVRVEAFGYTEVYTGITSIHGDFGGDDDTLMLTSGFALPVTALGGDDDDVFSTGGTGTVHFDGGNDNDLLIGGPGVDTLIGGSGHDYLDGKGGLDSLDGGSGDDVIFGTIVDFAGESPIGGIGFDTLEVRGTAGADAFTVQEVAGSKIEIVAGASALTVGAFESVIVVPGDGADSVAITGDLRVSGLQTFTVSLVEDTTSPYADTVTVTLLDTDDNLTLSGTSALSIPTSQRAASGVPSTTIPSVYVPTSTTLWTEGHTTVISATDSSDLITVRTLAGIDNVLVPSLVADARIETGSDADRVAVGSNAAVATNTGGTLEAIDMLLTVDGGDGADHLTIDDSGEGSGQTGTLTDALLTGFGLTGGGISYSSIATLDLFLGSGGDELSVLSTANGTVTTADAGTGADAVHVSSDAPTDLGVLHDLAGALVLVGGGD
ncbi:MAG: hypothetical protein U9R51_04365, partial [Actinomycetota bacterium]|nr:hypothetical protein [Actinomycetota bacterium]